MIFNKKHTFEQHDNEEGSYYKSTIKPFKGSSSLDDNLKVDICVVGGGLTGISSSLHLAQKGYTVALLEARKLGWGASGRNGGQLGIGMRKDQKFIEKKFGLNHAKELWKLGLEAVDESKNLILENDIKCNLQNGVLSAGIFNGDKSDFLKEIDHMSKFYNFQGYEFLNKKEIHEEIQSKIYNSGMLNKFSYHINPLRFLMGMAELLIKLKVRVYENTPVKKILEINDGVKLYTDSKTINADRVVVACNGYLDKLLGNLRNTFMPINNYIVATEPLGETEARKIIKNNYAVSDTRFIIDYYRFSEDWRMIFGGGETFTSQFMKDSKKIVINRMYKVFPSLMKYKIDYSWGGTLAITVNRMPSFGSIMNDKLIYAHGYSGHGLALSVLAGKLISEKISGNSERFDFIKKINNFSIPGGDYLRRPIYTSAVIYYKFLDFLKSFN
ncbi:MAG: Gamma-glutamylputrescine oxidoreductase [Alphaproteobacteria bacterium MarineAlpha5_Bin7]|nr:MAG: Gamma-glutamylputrescine oxidoreductase [Alphaproteobacteria bacterium MarineAlpha5_Bin7]|tara:strand:- start:2786 stop:4111 length:1326 start_codon:yes stop_codon:yes gene_type:complete